MPGAIKRIATSIRVREAVLGPAWDKSAALKSVGMSRASWSNYARGRVSYVPSGDVQGRITIALGLPRGALLWALDRIVGYPTEARYFAVHHGPDEPWCCKVTGENGRPLEHEIEALWRRSRDAGKGFSTKDPVPAPDQIISGVIHEAAPYHDISRDHFALVGGRRVCEVRDSDGWRIDLWSVPTRQQDLDRSTVRSL